MSQNTPSHRVATNDDATMQKAFRLNAGVRVHAFDDADVRDKILYELADENARVLRMSATKSLHRLISSMDGERSLSDYLEQWSSEGLTESEIARLRDLIVNKLIPNRILIKASANSEPAPSRNNRPDYMLAKRSVVPAWLVNAITRRLVWLYSRAIAPVALVVIGIGLVSFFVAATSTLSLSVDALDSATVIQAFIYLVFGAVAHEFGHATAGYRSGARQMDLGVGWYLYFPVFYADLSEAWRFSRRERAIADAGGLYFQSLYTAILMLAWWMSPDPAVLLAASMLSAALVFNLNPFFRLDGYWIASDLLGVANLRQTAAEALRNLALKALGKPPRSEQTTALSPQHQRMLLVYTIASNVFFVFIAYLIATQLIWRLLENIPAYVASTFTLFIEGGSPSDWVVAISALAFQFMLAWFVLIFITGAIRRYLSARQLVGTGDNSS